ncbi:alpha-2C adrenergic receptor-like isoform X3 [Pomacea canaliculata]|uniref:alpha-2C adrenergic receptor-like isoform X3 n=1 Tax=Pomacea canaliculata TaxID=400727 RepID=UPI000D73D6C3|nr:alpha-2C adrenergic receptor-like isoform X3 [Pomacea canaliculata]
MLDCRRNFLSHAARLLVLCRDMDMGFKQSSLAMKDTSLPYSNWTEEEKRQRLEQLSYDTFLLLLPTVFFLVVLMVIGLPGNLLVIFVYFKQFPPSATRVFVLALAFCDLSINVFGFPRHIILMRYSYCSQGVTYCRLVGPVAVFPILLSYWLLVCVALERRHRICNPLGHHLDPSHAIALLVVPFTLTTLVLFPFLGFQEEGTFDIGIPGLQGIQCTFPTITNGTDVNKVYGFLLIFSFASILTLLILCYLNILLVVLRQREQHGRSGANQPLAQPISRDSSTGDSAPTSTHEQTDLTTSTALKATVPGTEATAVTSVSKNNNSSFSQVQKQQSPTFVVTAAEEPPMSSSSIQTDQTRVGQLNSGTVTFATSRAEDSISSQRQIESEQPQQHVKQHDYRGLSKTTLMMLVLTGATVICCVPYFYMELSRYSYVGHGLSPFTINIRFLARVFPSVNSVINPFIYNFFNPRFQVESQRFITKMKNYLFQDF